MKDFPLLLLPGPSPCSKDRLLRAPLGAALPAHPKTLFPEHKLTGALLKLRGRERPLSCPAVMGCRLSLALGAVCPCPASWLPEVWARWDTGGFSFCTDCRTRCQFPDPTSFLSLQLLRASLPLLQFHSGTAPGSLPKCLTLSSCFPHQLHHPLTASCPTFFHLPPLQTLLWSTEAI